MTLRCRKGDMAMIVVGHRSGSVVDVLDFCGTRDTCDGVFPDLWYIADRGQETNPENGNHWVCPDSYLIPIRPGDLKETDETEKTLEFTE